MGGGSVFCCTLPTSGLEELFRFHPRATIVLVPVEGFAELEDVVWRPLLDEIEKVAVA